MPDSVPTTTTPTAVRPELGPGVRGALERAVGLVAGDVARAETRLAQLLRSEVTPIPDVARHCAMAGGKRLRPLVTLLCARAGGYDDDNRITVAAVSELLHTATLLHDDVVDGGEFRRGRPAARMKYGNGLAVLTGDFCLSSGLVAIAQEAPPLAYRTMAQTVMRMSEGEVAQLYAAGGIPSRARYYDIIDRKTSALLAWAASVAGLSPHASTLVRFGTELGYAFQIADDVLDTRAASAAAAGSVGVTGKDGGQDLREGKVTLPVLIACELDAQLHARVDAALAGPCPVPMDEVAAIVARARALHAPAQALAVAHDHVARAQAALAELPDSEARDALHALTAYVARRDR